MHDIDDRIDVKFEHALKRGVDEAEIPDLGSGCTRCQGTP
jgi:hypothetical protein